MRVLVAVTWLALLAPIAAAQTPPTLEIGDEGCPEQRIHDYLERHGDFGRIDPHLMLELTRAAKESIDANRRLGTDSIDGNVWKSLGPTNGAGRATAIALHPTIDGTAIVGAAGGGAWKTTDGGISWRALTDDIPNLSVGAIAYAPSNPNIVYLGTGEGGYAGDFIPGIGLLSSTDGGETWALPTYVAATQYYKLLVDPANPQEILAATNGGLWRSTSGPNGPWNSVIHSGGTPGYGDVTEVVRDPTNAQTLYAATWDRLNWCARSATACSSAFRFESPTIQKSTDGGVTWTPASNGLPVSTTKLRVNRFGLAIAQSSPNTLYVSTSILDVDTGRELCHVYKTTDGAATWTETNLTNLSAVNTYMNTQAWYDNTLVVSPTDPNVVLAGGVGFARSTDGGTTWARALTGVHSDIHELRYDAAGLLWIASDGGVWTVDASLAATAHNQGLVTRQFYDVASDPVNRNRVYGGQQDNGTIYRGDGGGTAWTFFSGGDGFACAVDPNAPAVAYSTIQGGLVFRTITAGSIYRVLQRTPHYDASEVTPFYSIVQVDPRSPSTVYTVSYRVWKSVDAGDGWTPVPTKLSGGGQWFTDATIRTLAISPQDPNVMMVGTASSRRRVYRTTNGGALWSDVTDGLPSGRTILHIEIDPRDSSHAFVALAGTGGDSVYATTDGGNTWRFRGIGLPLFSTQTVRFDPTDSRTVYAGTDIGVYRSLDGGNVWERFGTGMPAVSVYDLEPLKDGSMLRAATHGRGVWELEITAPVNASPTVLITAPAQKTLTVARGTTVTFSGDIADPDLDPVSSTWTFADTWTTIAARSGSPVIHRFDRAGRYPVGLAAVDARGGVGAATVEVDVLDPADACTAPVVIPSSGPFPFSVTIDTDLATKQATDPRAIAGSCYPFTTVSSTWLTFTAPTAGTYQFSLCGSSVSAVLLGFSGDACSTTLTNLLCIARTSTSADCQSPSSTQELALAEGQTIRLLATNYFSSDWGPLTVTVTQNNALSPLLTGIVPAAGSPGSAVVLEGIGFQAGATVTIGGEPAADVVVVSNRIITATAPVHAGASVDVTVTNPDGTTGTLSNGFTYGTPGPKRRAAG